MNRKIIIFTAVVTVLIAAAICLLPWPFRIDERLYAKTVSEFGIPISNSNAAVELKGWKLNYLFREDTVKFSSFEIDGTSFAGTDFVPFSLTADSRPLISWSVGQETVTLVFDAEHQWFEFTTGTACYCLSSDAEFDLPRQEPYALSMEGYVVNGEGAVTETLALTVSGSILDYPFGTLRFTMQADFPEDFQLADIGNAVFTGQTSPYLSDSCFVSGSGTVSLDRCRFAVDPVAGLFILDLPGQPGVYLTASVDPNTSSAEIMDYFADFLNAYSFEG